MLCQINENRHYEGTYELSLSVLQHNINGIVHHAAGNGVTGKKNFRNEVLEKGWS